jgi:hypothetical protein
MARSRRTPAILIYPCRSELFTTEAVSGRPATVFPLGREQELLILYSGFVVEKPRTAWVR